MIPSLLQLSVRCKYCGAKLAFPINSETDLLLAYSQLAGLYYDHLFYKHLDAYSHLDDGQIILERAVQ